MGKGIILGIDFSMDFTQMAFLDEDGNPQSICVGTEENYQIPTVVYYDEDMNEWSAGDEAINKSTVGKGKFYDKLPLLLTGIADSRKVIEIMSVFISYLLKIAVNYCNGRLIKNIVISLDEINPSLIEGINDSFENLGYEREDVKIISHSESFVYYVLNQNKDIWINNVYYFDFNRNNFSLRKLNVVKGRQPYVASVSVQDLEDKMSFEMAEQDPETADTALSEYMDEKMKSNIVSGVYLSGEGFYMQGWEKTLSVLCRNRRVFKGNNLIVKGAADGAREFFYSPVLDQYLISCKGRTSVKVTMSVKHKGRESVIVLSDIGEYWYEAHSTAECIMESPTEAKFEIQDIINRTNESFKIDLTEFPKRPPNTTRIEVNFRYLEENKFEIRIKDLGFGDFFESSGMTVKREITIDQQRRIL